VLQGDELPALLGPLILAAVPVAIILLGAFRRSHSAVAALAMAGLVLALAGVAVTPSLAPRWPLPVTPLFFIDNYSLFYSGLIIAAGLVVAALSVSYLGGREGAHVEYYALLLLASLGAVVLASASHFASLFLGLEILSISLYALIGYSRRRPGSLEAALKYLALASATAAFLVFGVALIYAAEGSMDLASTGRALRAGGAPVLSLIGVGMLAVGIGFKLAVAPFHMWTPDVYQGAPAPVAAFVATASKGAMAAVLLRYFAPAGPGSRDALALVFTVIAVASMLAGNLLALLQSNVKRILAYSSIAHLGYLLVAFLAGGPRGVESVGYYLLAYFTTTLGAFGVVTALSGPDRDADALADYQGLFWRRPWMAAVLTASLLSLAGIPLTGGFLGKFYVALAGVESSLWLAVLVLVVSSAIGLFYYLRLVVVLYLPAAVRSPLGPPEGTFRWGEAVVLGALLALLLWMGIDPGPFLDLIHGTVAGTVR
jgi:NADH-quinone oxidoreductase subunit N